MRMSAIDPNASHYDRYWQYIYERQLVWHRRFIEQLPPPWTTDPILQEYSFTNVYRELDRGTVFYVRAIMEPILDFSHDHIAFDVLTFLTLAYRRFNRIDTWQNCFLEFQETELWQKYMLDEVEERMRVMAARTPVFTGAFWVCGYGGYPGHDKIAKVMNFVRTDYDHMVERKFSEMLAGKPTPKQFHQKLTRLDGIGPFLAYEVYSDLIYSSLLPFDENDWANPGPGAKKGMDLVFDFLPNRDYERLMYRLRDEQSEAFQKLDLDFESISLPHKRHLTMRNIEHNLCEYSKYARGKARMRFNNHGNELYSSGGVILA